MVDRDVELTRLLETPEMVAKMTAAGVHGPDRGFAEKPGVAHRRLWAMVLEARPDWRPWYEELREEAARAWADPDVRERLTAYRERVQRGEAGPGVPHEEVQRLLGLDAPDEGDEPDVFLELAMESRVNALPFEELVRIGDMVVEAVEEARRDQPRYALLLSGAGEWWAARCQTGLVLLVPQAVKFTGCRKLSLEEGGRAMLDAGDFLFNLEYEEAEGLFTALEQGMTFQLQRGWL